MPSTYGQIKSALPQFGAIDDPQWNIAAGILHDHDLWTLWNRDVPEDQRWAFMFASYNAGEGTIMRARRTAAPAKLDQSRVASDRARRAEGRAVALLGDARLRAHDHGEQGRVEYDALRIGESVNR